ncbi:histidine phosphatase family protein [Rhodoferax sp. AJA081-3]|uniref:histidine phosphatase family protein n=1 Tax=Rhodoferax sp. AJA081-3 TaxID=2752316 RepID=UPI001ADEBF0B|nr:histidine phosphatase family protein [Rhodoferax sp. AJA081-3]QTN30566.1 histidine phosphatase family protein [Rhodoferax sp. AJA081-3]
MTGATRIIAIRHGETAWNVETRLQGHLDIGLNVRGQWQAARAAEALADEDIAAIYSSDLSRASATAQAIADKSSRLGARQLRLNNGLRERGFGIFEGQTYAQIASDWPEESKRWRQRDPHFAPHGGETLTQLRDRIAATVNTLASQHVGEQIVLVAHGGVMDALYRLATRQTIESPRTWDLGNAAINRLLWTPDGLSLVGWSDTRHLEDAETLDETST